MTLHQPFYNMAKENINELIIFYFIVLVIQGLSVLVILKLRSNK